MKIKPNINVSNFFEQVRACKSDVFFVTDEGDRLNLRSQICQYLFTVAYLNQDISIQGRFEFDDKEDMRKLKAYME